MSRQTIVHVREKAKLLNETLLSGKPRGLVVSNGIDIHLVARAQASNKLLVITNASTAEALTALQVIENLYRGS